MFTSNCLKYVSTPADEKVAMLVPNDYATGSDDEKDAAAWFKKNYVDAGKGAIFTPATIDDLDISTISRLLGHVRPRRHRPWLGQAAQ